MTPLNMKHNIKNKERKGIIKYLIPKKESNKQKINTKYIEKEHRIKSK